MYLVLPQNKSTWRFYLVRDLFWYKHVVKSSFIRIALLLCCTIFWLYSVTSNRLFHGWHSLSVSNRLDWIIHNRIKEHLLIIPTYFQGSCTSLWILLTMYTLVMAIYTILVLSNADLRILYILIWTFGCLLLLHSTNTEQLVWNWDWRAHALRPE